MNFLHSKTDRLEEAFKRIARKYPRRIAISHNSIGLTYEELDDLSDKLAKYICSIKKTESKFIGLLMIRSTDMIIGMLGILKAGFAYVPIDPVNSPEERLNYYVSEAKLDLVLSNTNQNIKNVDVININEEFFNKKISSLKMRETHFVKKTNTAYVIFTSGTTGKPKGVLIEHCNVVELFQNSNSFFGFTKDDIWTLFHSFSFDFSVWETWGAFLFGGELVIVPNAVSKNVARFYNFIKENKITILSQTPQALINLSKIDQTIESRLSSLKYIILGGEKVNLKVIESWIDKYSFSPKIINGYGVTEATIFTTFKEFKKEDFLNMDLSPIGHPVNGSSVLLINDKGEVGNHGEIHISGYGVSNGYLNREELTKEKFVNRELNGEKIRVYKTGDIAFRENGQLYYINRSDNQIKFHGYRIELEEIEKVILNHPKIIKSIVIVIKIENYKDKLISFLETSQKLKEHEKKKLIGEVKTIAKIYLPFYMIPSDYIILNNLPLTVNGKVDIKKLKETIN